MPRPDRILLLLAGTLVSGPAQGEAPAQCVRTAPGSIVSLRIDNDILGAQDQGYSNGIQAQFASATLGDVDERDGGNDLEDPGNPGDPEDREDVRRPEGIARDKKGARFHCRWPLTGWLARRLGVLRPSGPTRQNLTFSVSHALFTPTDRGSTGLIRGDRPYAAALLLGLGHNARSGNRLHASLLRLGIVGPSARGEQAQNQIHKLTGDKPFLGWRNQLHDEFVFGLLHERLQRHVPAAADREPGASRRDAVTHWGASIGNLVTQVGFGGELRWGRGLPDDFGSNPARLAGRSLAGRGHHPGPGAARGPGMHGFVSIDARWVLRDIALDGNTFRHSHRVDKKPMVADFGYGFVLDWGAWKMVLARFHRTREFEGQKDQPVFGSVTVSRRLSF